MCLNTIVYERYVKTSDWDAMVQALEAKIAAMKEAQKIFATYTQEQVDKIFKAAATAADKARIPLAKAAVEDLIFNSSPTCNIVSNWVTGISLTATCR